MIALERAWYGPRRWLWLLWPLHGVMSGLVYVRRMAYHFGIFHRVRLPVPIIVVGNITVGGTGKTPLCLALVKHLQARSFKPGIISRGYRAETRVFPLLISDQVSAAQCGDEPKLLALRSQVPVVIDPDRVRGAQRLLQEGCDVIISDDGLQHYRLHRDIEISVVDAVRQVGNHWLLPAGPLREPVSRLQSVDLRVANGAAIAVIGEHGMQVVMSQICSLREQKTNSLADWKNRRVYAVAGIGYPERFFAQLERAGLQVERHPFPDHHVFTPDDLPWRDAPIVMTEKDAVKCRDFDLHDAWFVPISAELPATFFNALDIRLDKTLQSR